MSMMPNEPQSIGRILDAGIKLYRASFKRVVPIALIGAVIAALPTVLVSFSEPADLGTMSITTGVFALLSALVYMWIYASMYSQLHDTAIGKDSSVGTSLGEGIGALLPALGVTILVVLIIMIGLILLVIPGIWLMVATSLSLAVLIAENKGPIAAIGRSRDLVRDNWWRSATVLTIAGIAIFVIFFAVIMIVSLATGAGMWTGTMADEADAVGGLMLLSITGASVVLEALLYPALYAVTYSLYHDLKIRKGGEDLAAKIASSSPAITAPSE